MRQPQDQATLVLRRCYSPINLIIHQYFQVIQSDSQSNKFIKSLMAAPLQDLHMATPLQYWHNKICSHVDKFNQSSKSPQLQLAAIKQMLAQSFNKKELGVFYPKQHVIQLVGTLIKRWKIMEQAMNPSRITPDVITQINEYLSASNYQTEKERVLLHLNEIQDEKANLEQKVRNLEQQVKKEKKQAQEKSKQLENLKSKLYKVSRQSSSGTLVNPEEKHIYMGQLLLDEPDYRQYLVNVLQRFMEKNVKGSKILYRMDLLNPTNFHKYIDNKPNLLLVALLKNGYNVAAFSEEAVSEKMEYNKKGLILSLTNRKSFRCFKRAATYDHSFIIFGNSQLRILSGKNRIFSNLGISNGYYENTGYQVNTLLGQGREKQAQMVSYQVLEVYFK